jgi:small neutral amino acid transporter SnatA (MarC family)
VFSYNIKSCNELEVKLALRGRKYSQNNGSFVIGESVYVLPSLFMNGLLDQNKIKSFQISIQKATHAGSVLQAEFALNRITNTKTAFCEWIWLQISAQNTKSDPE